MKKYVQNGICKLMLLCSLIFANLFAFAQDGGGENVATTTTHSTTTTTQWYTAPWVWIVGAVVLVLILVALFRGNSGTTDRTTIIKD